MCLYILLTTSFDQFYATFGYNFRLWFVHYLVSEANKNKENNQIWVSSNNLIITRDVIAKYETSHRWDKPISQVLHTSVVHQQENIPLHSSGS
jgi:hypothetical protein